MNFKILGVPYALWRTLCIVFLYWLYPINCRLIFHMIWHLG